MVRPLSSAFAFAFSLALPSCGDPTPVPNPTSAAPTKVSSLEPPPATPPTPTASVTEVRDAMHRELLRAVAIRDAVIAGELEDTRTPARGLVNTKLPVPPAWQPHVSAMQTAAREVLEARDVQTAAAATGRLARECGGCHAENGVRHDPSFPPAPSPAPGAQASMQLHQWATERLYQGLISANDSAWQAGADALVTAPLHIKEITTYVELPEDLHGLAKTVHDLGTQARTTTAPDVRARIYGELLASCAACHKGGC